MSWKKTVVTNNSGEKFLKDFKLTTVITGRHISTDEKYLDRDAVCQNLIEFLRGRFIPEEGLFDVIQETANISEVLRSIRNVLSIQRIDKLRGCREI